MRRTATAVGGRGLQRRRCGDGARGFTVLELLVSVAILLLATGAIATVLHDNLLGTPVLEEATDLQQRTRIAVETLTSDLRAAGIGTEAGALSVAFPAIVPRRAAAAPTTAESSAVTIRYVPPGGARSRLAATVLPGDAVVPLEPDGACVRNAVACGFSSGTFAVLVASSGEADVVRVDGIGAGTLSISDPSTPRSVTYDAGAIVAEIREVGYRLDATARQLRRDEGGGSFAVAENVTGLGFDYFGSMDPPTEPRPPVGTANCLYAADGSRIPHAWAPGTGGTTDPLPLASLVDGPFCGSGPLAYDADLLKVRSVRMSIRLETGLDSLRGSDPRLFARPGTATGRRLLPDAVVTTSVALRNPGR